MKRKTKQTEELEDSLAEGIASVIAANEALSEPPPDSADMADLFLEELNRLWAEPTAIEAN